MTKFVSRAGMCAAAVFLCAGATGAEAATYAFNGKFGDDNDKVVVRVEVEADDTFVAFRNWGYGGGTFAADYVNGIEATEATVGAGNFDGMLQLLDSSGALLFTNDNTQNTLDGFRVLNSLVVNTEYTVTNGLPGYTRYQDPEIQYVLDAGVYYLVLTQYYNNSEGGFTTASTGPGLYDNEFVSEGVYKYDGGTYTNSEYTSKTPRDFNTGCSTGYFCDVVAYNAASGYNRNNQFLLELAGVRFAEIVYTDQTVTTPVPVPAAAPMLLAGLAGLGAMAASRMRKAS